MGEQHVRGEADTNFCDAPTEGGQELQKHKRKGRDGKHWGPGFSRGLRESEGDKKSHGGAQKNKTQKQTEAERQSSWCSKSNRDPRQGGS